MRVIAIPSKICTAFKDKTIGSKVTAAGVFCAHVIAAIEKTDFAAQRVPGQACIPLPGAATQCVSAGVGLKMSDEASYVLRSWRGSVGAYLRREYAAETESVAVVVYTVGAYLGDPEASSDAEEVSIVKRSGATHIIVAVLASAGPNPPLSPGRFVSNLAGGNKEALVWTADEIRAKAREISAYANEWDVVAD